MQTLPKILQFLKSLQQVLKEQQQISADARQAAICRMARLRLVPMVGEQMPPGARMGQDTLNIQEGSLAAYFCWVQSFSEVICVGPHQTWGYVRTESLKIAKFTSASVGAEKTW